MSSRKEQKEQLKREREASEAAAAAAASRSRRLKIIGGAVGGALIVVVVAVVVSLGGGNNKPAGGSNDVENRFKGIPQSGITLGKPDAPVTLVEFADLKCPVCRDFAIGAFPTIVSDYVKTGKVRMELRLQTFLDGSTPGTPDSTNAATMAIATSFQNKLWNFADLFYINQGDESTVFATDAWLKNLAADIPGLDVDRALTERKSKADKIDKEITAASDKFTANGFQGTPSFLIGKTGSEGTELSYTALDKADEFVTAIEEELK